MQRKLILGVVGFLAIVLVVWGVAFARPYKLHGSEIDTQVKAPSIRLTKADGSLFDINQSAGRFVLLFFGYTSCPDVCPTTLADMKRVKEELGNRAENIDVVFITVDPQRDTPERIQQYASGFNSDFVGLSGSEADLQPIWNDYGVYRKIQESTSALGYLVDHTARVYLIDNKGNLRVTYAYGTPVDDLVSDLRFLMRED